MDDDFLLDEPLLDRSAHGIALAIGQRISTGELPVGQRLPTVRAVAKQLGISPTTVSDSWRILQSHGAIATDGRRGTFVRGTRHGLAPGRYWQVPVEPGTFALDLSTGNPDPELLPDVGALLQTLHLDLPVTSYLDAPVVPELEAQLRATWPFDPSLLTIVDGAQDALDRLVQSLLHIGNTVLINDPGFPPVFDMLDQVGAQIIGIPLDDEGIIPAAVEAAMVHNPVAIFLQPRAHNPTGVSMSAQRAEALADVIAGHDTVVIEDDHSGAVSGAPLFSIGSHLPEQVVHIRSFSKSHGPDLRLAAVGGAAGPIGTVVQRRRLGPSWSSRLLQQLMLSMLTDTSVIEVVQTAELEYERRRSSVIDELAARDVTVSGSSGINVWVPVEDEQSALVSLAANGIGAAPGNPFRVRPTDDQHIRISIGNLAAGADELAEQLAKAAWTQTGRPKS